MRPKNLCWVTKFMFSFPNFRTGSGQYLELQQQKCIATVLLHETVNQFLRVQLTILLMHSCNCLSMPSTELDRMEITKSSIYNEHSIPCVKALAISFSFTLNKVVDKIAPCGTPSSCENLSSYRVAPNRIWNVLSLKKFWIKIGRFPRRYHPRQWLWQI